MKKFLSLFACFAVCMFAFVGLTGCTKKSAITYAISVSCSDSLYADSLSEHFKTTKNGNTFRIEAIDTTGNAILAKHLDDANPLKVNIYLTNSLEKFYRAKFERTQNRVSGLTTRMQDVTSSTISITVTCPDAYAMQGLTAVKINIAQGSINGVCAVNDKGNKAVEMDPITIVLEVVPFNANAQN